MAEPLKLVQKSIPLKLKSVASSAVSPEEAVEVIGSFRDSSTFDICAQARNSQGPFIHIISWAQDGQKNQCDC